MTTPHEYSIGDAVWFWSPREINPYQAEVIGLDAERESGKSRVRIETRDWVELAYRRSTKRLWVSESSVSPRTKKGAK